MDDARFSAFLARADLSASLFPFANEARRARASESALLARTEADARRVAELEESERDIDILMGKGWQESIRRVLQADGTPNELEFYKDRTATMTIEVGDAMERIATLESELARLRDHLEEEHCCNCDEAARQGLAPTQSASGEKAGMCGTCGGEKRTADPSYPEFERDCPDCNGTGQTPETRP